MRLGTSGRLKLSGGMIILTLASMLNAQDQQTIHVNTRLVEVEVVVRGKSGPVSGLTKQDFTLLDKGKPQEIAVFSVKSKSNSTAAVVPLPPGVVSNRLGIPVAPAAATDVAGGATVLLVDRLNTAFENQPYLREQMLHVLASLKQESPIAVYILGRDLSVAYDFTGDPGRLIRAAAILSKAAGASVQPGDEQLAKSLKSSLEEVLNLEEVDRSLVTSTALERIAQHMSRVRGRKSLVWLSGSFPLRYQRPVGGVDMERIDGMAKASNDGNMAIYPVDVKGLSAAVSFRRRATPAPIGPPGVDIMQTLARETGGRAFYNSNDIGGAIQQAMDDAEVTYTLGFYPSAEALDGKYHPLQVKVAKTDPEGSEVANDVRYRQGYVAAEASPKPNPEHYWLSLDDIFDDPLDASAVGLAAMAKPVPDKPGTYSILVRVNVADLHLDAKDGQWAGTFDLAIQLPGAIKAKVHRFEIRAKEEQLRELLEKGFVRQEPIETDGSGGMIRVAVQDRNTGAAGSVSIPVP
jgi:VWFA-related protein